MAAKKKRRVRSSHPGVVLIPPRGRHATWRARFADPDTGRETAVRLDPVALPSAETRRTWAIQKSKAIARRKMELEAGAPRATGTKLSDAVAKYFDAHPNLSPRTRDDYRTAIDSFLAWAGEIGLTVADDVTRARLLAYREAALRRPKRVAEKGAKRGRRKAAEALRAPESVNTELRKTRVVLSYLRAAGMLPAISNDDLRDGLKRFKVPSERIEFLRSQELVALLEAALAHDLAVFTETRAEHAGKRPIGTTAKFATPVAPFVAICLLTGMRYAEALGLEWSQIDLTALDHEGRQVGEIHLAGARVKTRKARTIDLAVSPALRSLLEALRENGPGRGAVHGLTRSLADAAAKRLKAEFGAPKAFGWQALRRTCGTYLTNAPGIFGAASAYRSAKQLGHSVAIAERHYLDVVRGIPATAKTLEAAMGIEEVMAKVVLVASGPTVRAAE